MLLFRVLLLGLASLLALPAGLGDHCTEPTRSPTVVDTATWLPPKEFSRFYVFSDNCDPDCASLSLYFMEESNGWDGLQRADDRRDDTCDGQFLPDAWLW